MRKTKIIATLGPASSPPDKLAGLVMAGVDAFRLNCSHASLAELTRDVRLIRRTAEQMHARVAIMLDLQGPRLRTGRLVGGEPALLEAGKRVLITTLDRPGDSDSISTNYRELPRVVKRGSRILLDDGNIELRVVKPSRGEVLCEVVFGGILKEHKGINIPGAPISLPTLTAKDKRDLEWGLDLGVDYIALSFVRRAADVLQAKARVAQRRSHAAVIAKIERADALERIDGILEAADGIMVARGDLAVELSAQEVPVIQKQLVNKSNAMGRMVIVATQMLESMIAHARPTRAESSDVANAIFDGADAVMLSGETAVGAHPHLAVKTMSEIAGKAETSEYCSASAPEASADHSDFAHALARAVRASCVDSRAKAVIVFTMTGHSARILSKYRPPAPIYALSPAQDVLNQLALCHGVTPLYCPLAQNTDRMIVTGQKLLLAHTPLKKGDVIIAMAGGTARHRAANMIKIQRLGFTAF